MPRVHVVCLQPSLDVIYRLSEPLSSQPLHWVTPAVMLGTHGVQVAQKISRLGVDTTVVCPIGGQRGLEFANRLHRQNIVTISVPTPGRSTPQGVILRSFEGRDTRLQEKIPPLRQEEMAILMAMLTEAIIPGELVLVSGDFPPGVRASQLRPWLREWRSRGATCVLDGPAHALITLADLIDWMIIRRDQSDDFSTWKDVIDQCTFASRWPVIIAETEQNVVVIDGQSRWEAPGCGGLGPSEIAAIIEEHGIRGYSMHQVVRWLGQGSRFAGPDEVFDKVTYLNVSEGMKREEVSLGDSGY